MWSRRGTFKREASGLVSWVYLARLGSFNSIRPHQSIEGQARLLSYLCHSLGSAIIAHVLPSSFSWQIARGFPRQEIGPPTDLRSLPTFRRTKISAHALYPESKVSTHPQISDLFNRLLGHLQDTSNWYRLHHNDKSIPWHIFLDDLVPKR